MLRVPISTSTSAARRIATLGFTSTPRAFTTCRVRHAQDSTLSHSATAPTKTSTQALNLNADESTLPAGPIHKHVSASKSTSGAAINGDWVLFHPVYSPEELKSVRVLFREAKTTSDKLAVLVAKVARFGFDLVSGYKHKPIPEEHNMSLDQLRKGGYLMTESQWLARILFLESIAGVPGMVAATVRHLRSLRLMKRDAGWIHTLLQEAENERMHLMTFMTLKKPSIFFRAMILGAQGVFYNVFFLAYLASPATAHRFVAYLEEEAVLTYTRIIKEVETGRLPEWENKPAPAIAKEYWRLAPNASLLDVIYAVRSDESTHRFVNHSLASLKQTEDMNPFAIKEPGMTVKGSQLGFERDESAAFVRACQDEVEKERTKALGASKA